MPNLPNFVSVKIASVTKELASVLFTYHIFIINLL